MKKKLIYCCIALLILSGCDGNFTYIKFEKPQPEGVMAEKSFDKKIQETFVNCANKDDKIVVTNNLIVKTQSFRFKKHRKDLTIDSTEVVDIENNKQLIKFLQAEKLSADIVGDTVFILKQQIDTIFNISESEVLKKYKDSYYLNFKIEESHWDVNRLYINDDSLIFGEIIPSDTLLRFDFTIKNVEIDEIDSTKTTEYLLKPTKKQLEELVKSNSFEKTDCYYRKKE